MTFHSVGFTTIGVRTTGRRSTGLLATRFLSAEMLALIGVATALLIVASSFPAFGEEQPDPVKIVRDASWNELHSKGHPFRFRLYKQDSKGSTLKEIVETKDGDVALLIEKNGEPLNAEQEQAERARLEKLLADPSLQAHRRKKEKEDSARGDEMVRLLPDAFLYTYEGMVEGPSGPCYRLSFKPNPAFTPPDREGEVYHGMVGELWVDQTQQRLTKIDAHLISDVNFGWGVLGRLYKGGSIEVENADVGLPFGTHQWETTNMRLRLQGTILMVKHADFSTTEKATDFRPVPRDMTYQDAIHMLLSEKVADSQHS